MLSARYLRILGCSILRKVPAMRTFEIVIALIVAALVFVVFKVLGLLIKFALIAAVLGFIAGLVLARLFRRD